MEEIKVNFCFRKPAIAYAASFFVTLALGAVFTYTATAYSTQTDKIIRFYGVFNPCIWFDHYPAKIFATAGMGLFIISGWYYSSLLLVYTYVSRRVFHNFWASIFLSWMMVVQGCFVNVFTTDLYPMEDQAGSVAQSASDPRRLHGAYHFHANGTLMTLVEEAELTGADIQIIKLHTLFYITWLLSELLLSGYVFGFLGTFFPNTSKSWGRWHWVWRVLCWFGMIMHACSMLVIIVQPDPKNEWYFRKELVNTIQHWLIFIDGWTFTFLWGWLPAMFYRLMIPARVGITMRFRLTSSGDDDGDVAPDRWYTRAIRLVVLVLGIGGAFRNVSLSHDFDHGDLLLEETLHTKPYAYVAAPLWLAAVAMAGVGLFVEVIHKWLEKGSYPYAYAIHGGIGVACLYGCLLRILERAKFADWFFYASLLHVVTWTLHDSFTSPTERGRVRVVLYAIAGPALFILSEIFSNVSSGALVWTRYLLLFWLALYSPLAIKSSDRMLYVKLGLWNDAYDAGDVADKP